jgi:hypothetical protein
VPLLEGRVLHRARSGGVVVQVDGAEDERREVLPEPTGAQGARDPSLHVPLGELARVGVRA